MNINALDAAIRQVAPIEGVIIGNPGDRETWRIDFAEGATPAEKGQATKLLRLWDEFRSLDDVKAECRRRILLIMTEDQQRNTLAAGQAAIMQHGPDPAEWPAELQARQASALTAWAEINRLRARSNDIEAMQPLPDDLRDDALWSLPS